MANATELYAKWSKNLPAKVAVGDFEKVLFKFLGEWSRVAKGTADMYVVEHPALSYTSCFGSHNTAMFSVESGRQVKGIWVQRLLKAIEAIQLYERVVNEKEIM